MPDEVPLIYVTSCTVSIPLRRQHYPDPYICGNWGTKRWVTDPVSRGKWATALECKPGSLSLPFVVRSGLRIFLSSELSRRELFLSYSRTVFSPELRSSLTAPPPPGVPGLASESIQGDPDPRCGASPGFPPALPASPASSRMPLGPVSACPVRAASPPRSFCSFPSLPGVSPCLCLSFSSS